MFLRKINPTVKLLVLILFSASLFFSKNLYFFILPFILLVLGIIQSKISFLHLLKILRSVSIIVFFSFILTLITYSLDRALMVLFRLTFTVISSYIFTSTTDMYLLSSSLSHVFGRSVSDIITISVTFIPVLSEQGKRIFIIQRNRTSKNKLLNYVKLLIPMFVCTLKRSKDLANAMKIRYYDAGIKRTYYRDATFSKYDVILIIFSVLYLFILWRMNCL